MELFFKKRQIFVKSVTFCTSSPRVALNLIVNFGFEFESQLCQWDKLYSHHASCWLITYSCFENAAAATAMYCWQNIKMVHFGIFVKNPRTHVFTSGSFPVHVRFISGLFSSSTLPFHFDHLQSLLNDGSQKHKNTLSRFHQWYYATYNESVWPRRR